MPIVHEYRLPALLRAEAAAAAYGGVAVEQQRRYNDEQARGDQEYQFRQDQADVENQLRAAELQQKKSQFNVSHALKTMQAVAKNQRAWTGLEYRESRLDQKQQLIDLADQRAKDKVQQSQLDRDAARQQLQMNLSAAAAQQAEEQKMQRFINIQEQAAKHPWSSQAQYDEFVKRMEGQFGMSWDFPQRAIAEQQMQAGVRRKAFVESHSRAFGLEPDVVDGLVIEGDGGVLMLTVPPRTLAAIAKARLDDQRMRDLKAQETAQSRID